MWKRYQTAGYVLAVLTLFAFLLGWKLIIASERPADVAEYQKRLNITAANIASPAAAEMPDESLRLYAVNIVHTQPFKSPIFGYGIYLGQGVVLTAAHMVGSWPFSTKPRVLIAGHDLPVKVVKQGSAEQTDLALLSVDQEQLPISLRLRRIPLCKGPLQFGTNVVVVYPERIARSKIISPLLIAPQYRTKFGTLINEPEGSGSGVFISERKCLLGIMSRQITKYAYVNEGPFRVVRPNGLAGYFVPVPAIGNPLSAEKR
jgi:hypothetical protein